MRVTLIDDVRDYVNRSHAYAWQRSSSQGKTPDEPGIVSAFLSDEMCDGLKASLQQHAQAGAQALVRGIFTHQTPMVKLTTEGQSVEIADLMLVHCHYAQLPGGSSHAIGRALLFQAKCTQKPETGSLASGTERIQFELYQLWNPFNGTRRLQRQPAGAKHWDFRKKHTVRLADPVTAGEYLTVFKGQAFDLANTTPPWAANLSPGLHHASLATYPSGCAWSAGGAVNASATASAGVSCPTDFGTAFVDFLKGRSGRPFVLGPTQQDDHWSLFVNEMLRISAPGSKYVYNSQNQNVSSRARGQDLQFLSTIFPLLHATQIEMRAFIHGQHDAFRLTNFLLRRASSSAAWAAERAPPNLSDILEAIPSDDEGHVPMLLVITVGENEQPFEEA